MYIRTTALLSISGRGGSAVLLSIELRCRTYLFLNNLSNGPIGDIKQESGASGNIL